MLGFITSVLADKHTVTCMLCGAPDENDGAFVDLLRW